MNEIIINIESNLHSFPIALVVSQFNQTITKALKEGAIARLAELGFAQADITLIEVPGAVEIPFVAQLLAEKKQVQAIVALGAVIRGETTHYDYVCEQVSQGCQRVMLDYNLPVIFGVLTTENEEQALARVGKGREAVDCAVVMHEIQVKLEK